MLLSGGGGRGGLLGGLPPSVASVAERQAAMRQAAMPDLPRGAPRMMPAPAPSARGGGGASFLEGAASLANSVAGIVRDAKRGDLMQALPGVIEGGDQKALLGMALEASDLGATGVANVLFEQYGGQVDAARAEDQRTRQLQANQMLARELFGGDPETFRRASALASVPEQFDAFVKDRMKPSQPGDLRQAWDPEAGRLVFATDEDIRGRGLQPTGAKPAAPDKLTSSDFVTLYDPNNPSAVRTVPLGSPRFNDLIDNKGWVKGTPPSGGERLMPVFDKTDKVVTYATPAEIRADRGRYGPVSAAPDGGQYRQRRRPVDDNREVFEVSQDGGKTWVAMGDPFARGSDPTTALLQTLFNPGATLDGNGRGAAPASPGPAPNVPQGRTVPAGGSVPNSPGTPAASAPVGAAPLTGDAAAQANLQRARQAVASGKDPAAVAAALRSNGIDPGQIPELRGY